MRGVYRWLRSEPLALVAFGFLVLISLLAIGADVFAPFDPLDQELRLRNMPPGTAATSEGWLSSHLLGTDPLGRDLLSRIIYGGRVSLIVGIASVVLSGSIGVLLGLVSGYRRGWIDEILMRIVDIMLGLPALLVVLLILFFFGSGLIQLVVVFGLIRWPAYARVTRGLMLSMREQPFVEGARALGASTPRIIFRHILPNLVSPIITIASLEMAIVILAEAGLSFLGLGLQPPTPSWGLTVASGRNYIREAWWVITFPGLAILGTTMSLNLLGDALRTATDPLRRGEGPVFHRADEREGAA